MKKQLPDISDIQKLSNTSVSVNVNMSECAVVKTESKAVAVNLDIRNGVQLQYMNSKGIYKKDDN